jgi:hypothetical protein
LQEFLGIEHTHLFKVFDQEMCYLDALLCVNHSLFVFVDLGKQRTDLHVCLAFVLKHFQSQGWNQRVVEVLLQVTTVYVG